MIDVIRNKYNIEAKRNIFNPVQSEICGFSYIDGMRATINNGSALSHIYIRIIWLAPM
jgi:hypothetical protein